ncbi:aconitase X catalytic domain-containing protein [Microbacterium sp. BG28]|uniref:aconitase X catalytic domain-containing protein n=1 Tax=Microbacterium sp. BG28 TaxID=3097356 RepID=UPI002A59E889|nr:aconitase X catalytic domain-containing protein [Microbacterium sp. BG28]MDY0829962.1 aconitase X catalytic domain-containing protein [Microbacterium sp. BG28]
MHLTDEEKRMRDGVEGDAVAVAMDLLIRYGDALQAERLVATRNVAGTMTQPSPAKAKLVAEGGWAKAFAVMNLDSDRELEIPSMRVPTCQLQHGFGADAQGLTRYPVDSIRLQEDAESYFTDRGVRVLGTCTPYQVGNLPVLGEHCAWMESSAVVYANSVLGARTNCEGAASTGAASLTGRIPYWGNHLPANRLATHLVRAETPVEGFREWGLLGYFVGELVQEARPAVVGSLAPASDADLKHFGAATATSGGVELYHLPGVTPEAPTLEAAFGRAGIPEAVTYGQRERRATYETLNAQGESTEVDFVLLGCPHASLAQVEEIAGLLEGRRLADGAQLWVMLPRALAAEALRRGWTRTITRAGGRVLTESCPAMSRAAPPGTRVMATDSAKQAHYLPAILGIEAWFGTTRECVDAAVTGRWRGELT